jgi:hypothetical protein
MVTRIAPAAGLAEDPAEEAARRSLDGRSVALLAPFHNPDCRLRPIIRLVELPRLSVPERDPVADRISVGQRAKTSSASRSFSRSA